MRRILSYTILIAICAVTSAQTRIEIPQLGTDYPRMVDEGNCRMKISAMMETAAGTDAMERLQQKIKPYSDRHVSDPEWIISRLQMYWDSHADEIYVHGEELDHVAGRAPVPTVRFSASRGTQTIYRRPKIEDIRPYQDSSGLWMHNMTLPGEPLEWADPRKTGRNVESINMEIMELARDAAFLYWWSGDRTYAEFAADIFDTYMTGLYYRNVPVDLNHGHQQTLLGLTSFEVIHEDIAVPAAECYDFLHGYLEETMPEKLCIYENAFKKWADCIIGGGVPHNNWNLIQAQFALRIALVLSPDSSFSDGHGREWYLNRILNEDSIRQWSPMKLIDYGFDASTGLWKESPGYSMMVVSEWSSFINLLDTILGVDLVDACPVLSKAVKNIPQYLFPNGIICGWGDTYYSPLETGYFPRMIENAQIHGKPEEERHFTAMYKCFVPEAGQNPAEIPSLPAKVSTFTSMSPAILSPEVQAGKTEDYTSPVFWSEGVSWFTARTGMNPQTSLMISVAGSMGNHAHANGISLELYGKGYIMAPDLGRGSGYSSPDYLEFYSQFPAHNTVCVDGISSYPIMQSHHAFNLNGCYPAPCQKEGFYQGVMFGDFSFVEPETDSDQRRQVLIINTDPENGYYIDIFRSRRKDGKDRMHDYFYHNIGQEFELSVPTEPTEELAFAGGHISAYSYLWNKSAAMTLDDVCGSFTMHCNDGTEAGMRMWMKGEADRKVFKVYSPHIDGLSRVQMPYDVKDSPCMTFVARQYGEAWERPFTAVYEPFSSEVPGAVKDVGFHSCGKHTVGITVCKNDGRTDTVISSDTMRDSECDGLNCNAVLAVVSKGKDGHDISVFMHSGTSAQYGDISISSKEPTTAAVIMKGDKVMYMSRQDCTIKISGKRYRCQAAECMHTL